MATPVGNLARLDEESSKKKHKLSFPYGIYNPVRNHHSRSYRNVVYSRGRLFKVAYVADSGVFQITEPDGNILYY